jgi:hypothetical protein
MQTIKVTSKVYISILILLLSQYYRFIYTGEVFVPQHELKDFLRTAELLEIKGLLKVKT